MTDAQPNDDVIEFEPECAPYAWAIDNDEKRRAFVLDRMALTVAHWDSPDAVMDMMQRAYDWLKTGESKKAPTPASPTKLRAV